MTSIEYSNDMYDILNWLCKLLNVEIEYWQIDCNTKKTTREKIINSFKQTTKIAIIINVHILDEGINIPECDSVFITQPSNNMINIIQRMCRANRILDNKTKCNIYLWCKEKKTDIILDYIYNNTGGFIKDKVFIHNTTNKKIEKHIIKKDNLILYDTIKNNDNVDNIKYIFDYIDKHNINISKKFVEEYYKLYIDSQTNKFVINLELLCLWLETFKSKIKDTLTTNFKPDIDYILYKDNCYSKGSGGHNKVNVLLTFECFKKIANKSRAKKSMVLQNDIITIDNIIFKMHNILMNKLVNESKQN